MKTYQVKTLAKTEFVEAVSVDESDLHVVRFIPANGRPKSYGRGTLVSYESVSLDQENKADAEIPQDARRQG